MGRHNTGRVERALKRWSAAVTVALLIMMTAVVGGSIPAQAATIETNSWYILQNRQSGKVLEVGGWSTADGGVLQQYTRNDGAWQQWGFRTAANGTYLLENRHSGKVVDLWGWDRGENAPFKQFTAHGGANQQFTVIDKNTGFIRFVNAHSGKALTVLDRSKNDFAVITSYTDLNQFNQQWQLIKVTGSDGGTTPAPVSPTAPWPNATSTTKVNSTIKVPTFLDGKMGRYYGISAGDQDENQPPMFELEDGAVIKNVIIGDGAGDGIHCKGTCTIENVWWENVGEDAATQKGKIASQIMTVNGGGARNAEDKVFQHNGPGKFIIKNFQVENFGKLYRSCGNCSTQYARSVEIDNVVATGPALSIAGINSNLGDSAKIRNVTIIGDTSRKIAICEEYQGVTSGEPKKITSGPSAACNYSASDITYVSR